MEHAVYFLCSTLGSHEKVAESLGYSIRHYRKIRKKIEEGEELPPRIENLIKAKASEMQTGGIGHACPSAP
mgnify:CR=1 FL=1|jgi:hypothetical protein